MKRKKTALLAGMLIALAALSLFSPLVIDSVAGSITRRIQKWNHAGDMSETELPSETENGDETIGLEAAQDGQEEKECRGGSGNKGKGKTERAGEEDASSPDGPFYEEPFYKTPEEEDAANRKAYQEMEGKLLERSEAVSLYRRHFAPAFDELTEGLMDVFLAGREDLFLEEAAVYCFGHYNTSFEIAMIRFDALIEDTGERATVILEFFTAEDLEDDTHVPDLALCTYNKKTLSYVFFTGGR